MVDVRRPCRAEPADPGNPAAQHSSLANEMVWWRQANRHGVPSHPGAFDDVSRRTLDVRHTDWQQGHIHPGKVLLFTPPPAGHFTRNIRMIDWKNLETGAIHGLLDVSDENGVTVVRNISGAPIRVKGDIVLPGDTSWRFEDMQFGGSVGIDGSKRITDSDAVTHIAFERCFVGQVNATEGTVMEGTDSLFGAIVAPACWLEYCTVMGKANVTSLLASDCIFAGRLDVAGGESSCIRYSRVPWQADAWEQCASEAPVFHVSESGAKGIPRGYAVLHPVAPDAIRFGAEDGGEMGAFHHRNYCLRESAVIDKLMDFLPLGIEPVLIPDAQLARELDAESN